MLTVEYKKIFDSQKNLYIMGIIHIVIFHNSREFAGLLYKEYDSLEGLRGDILRILINYRKFIFVMKTW